VETGSQRPGAKVEVSIDVASSTKAEPEMCSWCGLTEEACENRRNGTFCPEYAPPDEDEVCDCGACTSCVAPWDIPDYFE
jgi:hypothetical protein